MKAYKIITSITLTIIILFSCGVYLYSNYFNKFGNYLERGLSENAILESETGDVLKNINAILESETLGTLILKKNGKFYYFPSPYNFFDVNNPTTISYYEGYWYVPRRSIRFTTTKKVFNTIETKINYKNNEYFFDIVYLENDKSLKIDYATFTPINDKTTEDEQNKLSINDKTINNFLKNKNLKLFSFP